MMNELLIFSLIGVFAGASAGLLGLGGGLITVPALLFVYQWQGMAETHIMHVAVATSLTAITITSLSSMFAHHRAGNVDWDLVRGLLAGLILGGLLGAYSATLFSSTALQRFFALYAFLMSIRLWLPVTVSAISSNLLARPYLFVAGTTFGTISALVGMGGGTMMVPYLVMAKQSIQKAIGTSAACGFPIALTAALGFSVFAGNEATQNQWQTGFIDWLAFVGVISTSILSAHWAAKWTMILPVVRLRQIFSVVLMLVSINLFITV